ncbi:cytoplasmic protein [Enterococcus sp. LJL128]|uniref:cytoplasmic protein n=1 Tax=Enterococcus sp. LJL51 TaxID=3416656 RepID=UPI003CEFD3E8
MNYSKETLKHAHIYCTGNKKYFDYTDTCGCFYCLKIFSPIEITFYLNEEIGDTAICPYCSIDSVLPNMKALKISNDFLTAMYDYWFSIS